MTTQLGQDRLTSPKALDSNYCRRLTLLIAQPGIILLQMFLYQTFKFYSPPPRLLFLNA